MYLATYMEGRERWGRSKGVAGWLAGRVNPHELFGLDACGETASAAYMPKKAGVSVSSLLRLARSVYVVGKYVGMQKQKRQGIKW